MFDSMAYEMNCFEHDDEEDERREFDCRYDKKKDIIMKSCPFCGGLPYEVKRENTSNGLDAVICSGCDVRFFALGMDKARNKWNTRV